jgi:hypothetical protein
MRTSTLLASIALVAMTASCGGDDVEEITAPAPPVAAEEEPADEGEEPASEGEEQVLLGQVGTEDNPDAFELFLTDESGEPVETLPAGTYSIRVDDLSEIHNFHLEGEGVDESTTVPEVGEAMWEVTLEPGDYTAICDPHPFMMAEFTVT